jgi:pantetheine-phosphate adenylyltransferase
MVRGYARLDRSSTAGPGFTGNLADLAAESIGVAVAIALYPGSFDPIHNAHVEIIETASRNFDNVVVAAVRNPQKDQALFTLDERKAMISESTSHLDNVQVTMFSSLVVDLAREVGADFIVKGIRNVADYEAEKQMARMNHKISGIDTLFIPCLSGNSYLASRLLREIHRYGGDVSNMVPAPVAKRLMEKQAET